MNLKDRFVLKELAGSYVLIPFRDLALDFNGIITLNETAKFLYEHIGDDSDKESLAALLKAEYDIDDKTAEETVQIFLNQLKDTAASADRRVPMAEMYPLIVEMLENAGEVTFTVAGVSMQPMIYNRRDTVTLVRAKLPLKKYDIPFFRMDDGRFILHRVIKINPDGTYECRGDNCWTNESNIRNEQIIGVVKFFTRNGKKFDVDKSLGYLLYTRTWKFFHRFKKYYKYFAKIKNKMSF